MSSMREAGIRLNKTGYLYMTDSDAIMEELISTARRASPPTSKGFELLSNEDFARRFPFAHPPRHAMLWKDAGHLSAHEMGVDLLDRARSCGTILRRVRVESVERRSHGVAVSTSDHETRPFDIFVNAAGPFAGALTSALPVCNEIHAKVVVIDPSNVSRYILMMTRPVRSRRHPPHDQLRPPHPQPPRRPSRRVCVR
jgi:glycine/D-amino acid oxidase-like deaminating enzyme